jgi:hypothetical protein
VIQRVESKTKVRAVNPDFFFSIENKKSHYLGEQKSSLSDARQVGTFL